MRSDEALAQAFGAQGSEVVHKAHPLLRGEDSPYARVVCPSSELSDLYAAISSPESDVARLGRHHIPQEAAQALADLAEDATDERRAGAIQEFLKLRGEYLQRLAGDFLRGLMGVS